MPDARYSPYTIDALANRYRHFPSSEYHNGVIWTIYKDGPQHDSKDATGVQVPQNVLGKCSFDFGKTWLPEGDGVRIFDGEADEKVYYYAVTGKLKDGTPIALCTEIDPVTQSRRVLLKKTADVRYWAEEPIEAVVTGDIPMTCCFFGDIKTTDTGKLVVGAYDGTTSYILTSTDEGHTFRSKEVYKEIGEAKASEITPAMLDDLNGIAIVRIDKDAGSLMHFSTMDGWFTSQFLGQTNLPISGGYQSHSLRQFFVNGRSVIAMTVMCRDATTAPTYPKSICAVVGYGDELLYSSTAWSTEKALVGGLPKWSGYPCLVENENGETGLTYGHETVEWQEASVKFKRCDIRAMIDRWLDCPIENARIKTGQIISTPPYGAGKNGTGDICFGSSPRSKTFAWDTVGVNQICATGSAQLGEDVDLIAGTTAPTPGKISVRLTDEGRFEVINLFQDAGNVTLRISPRR